MAITPIDHATINRAIPIYVYLLIYDFLMKIHVYSWEVNALCPKTLPTLAYFPRFCIIAYISLRDAGIAILRFFNLLVSSALYVQ